MPTVPRSAIITVLALIAMMITAVPAPALETVRPPGVYSEWHGLNAGYYNLDQRLTVYDHTPDKALFWAHQFGFVGGGGGYIGLQMAPGQKWARFSLWDATAAQGPGCQPFGGEGEGYTCVLSPYTWVPGRAYRLRVWQMEADGAGRWWGAWVQDTVTGTDSHIGKIRMPHDRPLFSFVSWTEYYGPDLAGCDQIPLAKAIWERPTGNNGSARATGMRNYVSDNGRGCPAGARAADVPSGGLQEKGITPLYTRCTTTTGQWQVAAGGPGPSSGVRVAEIAGARTDDGAPAQLWDPVAWPAHQKWRAECQSDGTWVLVNAHSGKCLEEPNPSSEGAAVRQFSCHRNPNQRWWSDFRGKDGNGRDYWVFVNKQDLRCLDIRGAAWANGTPLQVARCAGTWNQHFTYRPA